MKQCHMNRSREIPVKIVYYNAQGIKSKRASILQIIQIMSPDIIAFTETHLQDQEQSQVMYGLGGTEADKKVEE